MLSDVIAASITHLEVKLAASAKCMVSTFVTWSAPFKLYCPGRIVLGIVCSLLADELLDRMFYR